MIINRKLQNANIQMPQLLKNLNFIPFTINYFD